MRILKKERWNLVHINFKGIARRPGVEKGGSKVCEFRSRDFVPLVLGFEIRRPTIDV